MNLKEQLAVVQKNPYAIEHIKNPSTEVQLAAVQENGYAIMYIETPSEEVKIIAALCI